MLHLLLPALIPSWRFFDAIGPSPRVEYHLEASSGQVIADWCEVWPRPARFDLAAAVTRLVWNPDGNEALYLVSCAERLLEDPTAERSAHLLARVAATIESRGAPRGILRVRVVIVRSADTDAREVVFTSPPAAVGPVPETP